MGCRLEAEGMCVLLERMVYDWRVAVPADHSEEHQRLRRLLSKDYGKSRVINGSVMSPRRNRSVTVESEKGR